MADLSEQCLINSIHISGEQALSAEKIRAALRLAEAIGLDLDFGMTEIPPDYVGATRQNLVDYAISQPAPPAHRRDTRHEDGGQCFAGLVRLNEYTDRHRSTFGQVPPRLRIAMSGSLEPVVDLISVLNRLNFTNDDPKAWHGFYPRHLNLLRSYAELRIAEATPLGSLPVDL